MANDDVHAKRREPTTPTGALDLHAQGAALLDQARGLAAGRVARSLTPHMGADLTQTLLALCEGRRLGEHPSPGPATLQVLSGAVSLHADEREVLVEAGQWLALPRQRHDVAAHEDSVLLLTVHATPDSD